MYEIDESGENGDEKSGVGGGFESENQREVLRLTKQPIMVPMSSQSKLFIKKREIQFSFFFYILLMGVFFTNLLFYVINYYNFL